MASKNKRIEDKLKIIRAGTILVGVIAIAVIAVLAMQIIEMQPVSDIINGDNGNGDIPFEEYNETENLTQPEENETEICDDECLKEKALAEEDVKYCDWISDEELQQECYVSIAGASMDACLKVNDPEVYGNCIIENANRTGNLSICDNLPEEQARECRVLFEPCYMHEDTEMRICLMLKHDDAMLCENDGLCLLNYSVEYNDETACDQISGEGIRTACKSYHAGQDLCIDLQSTAKKEYCWELYAILTDNRLMCTQITTESEYAVACYSYFAAKSNDITFCDAQNIQLNDRWDCYTAYALGTGDMSGCTAIDKLASTHRFNCFFEFGKQYGNPMVCPALDDPGFAKTCYVGVIMNNTNLNWEYCADIPVEDWKNKCYTESAKLEKDISLCDFIVEELEREICTDSYQTFINGSD